MDFFAPVSQSRRLLLPRLCLAALALVANAAAAAAESATRSPGICPDLSGHFRVAGAGHALGDAVARLRIRGADFTGSEVKLRGGAGGDLQIWVKEGTTGRMPSQPRVVLRNGPDFTCKDGQFIFSASEGAERLIEQEWYQGESTVVLRPGAPRGLTIIVTFSGRARMALNFHGSNFGVQKPGTRKRELSEEIRWPDIAEPYTPPKEAVPEAPEPKAVVAARQMLNGDILRNVILTVLKVSGDAVVANFHAKDSKDFMEFEDRLRAAAIPYKVVSSPRWGNNASHMAIKVWPEGGGPGNAWHPSVLRIESEIDRMGLPNVYVKKIDDLGDAYVAEINIRAWEQSGESIAARLGATTGMFSEITLISEWTLDDQPKTRVARLRLRVR